MADEGNGPGLGGPGLGGPGPGAPGLLELVDGPDDLKRLDPDQLVTLAAEIRDFIVRSVAVTGGHVGSNLGVVELTLALHRVFDSPKDIILWDTGHQAYVHKIVTGRWREFGGLRQRGGLSGYPSRVESEHDWVENSHASTILSYAYGLATAHDLRRESERRVVAVVGDGSMTGEMAYEALNNIGHSGRRVLVVLNDNSRSYAPTVGGLAAGLTRVRLAPTYVEHRDRVQRLVQGIPWVGRHLRRGVEGFRAGLRGVVEEAGGFFEALGVRYIGPVDGHDIAGLERVLAQSAAYDGPVVVHVVTQKGRGYKPAEDDQEKHLHDAPAFDPAVGPPRWAPAGYTEAFAGAMVDLGERDPRVVAITAAMGGPTGLRPFQDRWPERFLDVGIAEQHAVTAAAGMAMAGLRPVVAVYSTFLSRAIDQINLDVGLHRLPVVFCIDRAGITGDDGPSHHGVLDLALLSQVPGITVLVPSSAEELRVMLDHAMRMEGGPVAIRYPKGAARRVPSDQVGSGLAARRLVEGTGEVCVLAAGLVAPALDAARLLDDQGVSATVWDMRSIKPLDRAMLADAARHRLVVTVEDGIRQGGAGSSVADALADSGVPVVVLGVPDRYLAHGDRAYILAALGLDGPGIAMAALAAWRCAERPIPTGGTVPRNVLGAGRGSEAWPRRNQSEAATLVAAPSTPLLNPSRRHDAAQDRGAPIGRNPEGVWSNWLGPNAWSDARPRPRMQPMPPAPRDVPLIGRRRELGELRAEQQYSDLGRLRVALVVGGPGLGKTRLAAEMTPSSGGSTVHLMARSSSLRPLPPIETWIDTLHRALSDDGRVPFPRHAGKGDERPAETVVRLLGLVSVRRSVTIVLDDVHWADESIWETLLRLSQDHADGRLFVLATARPGEMPGRAAAAEALTALDQGSFVHRIEIDPLGADKLGELAAAFIRRDTPEPPPARALVDWLQAHSEGNPRLAVGLLEALVDEDGDPAAPLLGEVPPTLVRWVLAEVARLEPSGSRLLDLLAVIGSPVDPGDLALMAEQPAAEVAIALEGLLRAELVIEHEHDRTLAYRIAYPLVGEILYRQVSGATRRVLHRRIAGTFLESGRAEEAASHFIRSARAGDAEAIDALIRQVAQAGRRGSHAEVWAIVPALIDLLPSGDERWLAVSDALSWPGNGSLTYKAERYTASEMGALLKIQEQLVTAGDLKRQASIRFRRAGFLAYGAGDKDSGQLECRHALELSRQAGREHEFRMAAIELAKMRGWFGDVRGQGAAARQLLAEAEDAGDQRGIVAALGALGVALGLQGQFAEAEAVLLRCVELAPSTELCIPTPQAVAVLGVLEVLQGRASAARARWPQASMNPQLEKHIWSSEVFVALLVGDLATVRERGRQANALDPEMQLSEPPWLSLLAAMAAAEGGRLADARRGLDLAARDHRGDDLDIFSQFRHWGEGVVAWAEDRLVAATNVLERAVSRLSGMPAPAVEAYLLADLVEVAVAAGERDTALRAAQRAEDIAGQIDAPSYQALHQFSSAWVLLAGGQHEDTADAASLAVDGLGRSGLLLLQARARVAYATSVRAADRRGAADALREAAATFGAAGASLRLERARRLLAQLGSSGRRAADRLGGPALTEREGEIAKLAARGFTARQIADGLHIGVRTVETHLARIYPKLGVTSKQQLISRGAELGLVPMGRDSSPFRTEAARSDTGRPAETWQWSQTPRPGPM